MTSFRFILAIGILVLGFTAQASHLRFGTIHWETNSRAVTFTITTAWRADYSNWNPSIGKSIVCEDGYFYPDNTSKTKQRLTLIVQTLNSGQNWFTATSVVKYTYSSAGKKVAFFQMCCRFRELLNNANGHGRLQASLRVTTGSSFTSIRTTTSPIITMLTGKNNLIPIYLSAAGGKTLTFGTSNAQEAAGSGNKYEVPSGLRVSKNSANTGTLSFRNPPSEGFYTIQAKVSDGDNSIPIDMIIRVIDPNQKFCKRFCANAGVRCGKDSDCKNCNVRRPTLEKSPFCDKNTPPRATRVEFTSINERQVILPKENECVDVIATRKAEMRLTTYVEDADTEDYVSVATTVLPPRASVTPFPSASHSGKHIISWTPESDDIGTVISYTFTDTLAFGNTDPLCVRINVVNGEMTASGKSLTEGVAGKRGDDFVIFNTRGQNHQVTITGASSAIAVKTGGTGSTYTFNYNTGKPETTITKAGSYLLVIKDTNPEANAPADLKFNLYIQNAPTDPTRHLIENSAGAGITGGISESFSTFLIHSKDQYDNDVLFTDGDRWEVEIWYLGAKVETVVAKQQIDPQFFLVNYTVPRLASDPSFRIRIYFTSESIKARTLVRDAPATILTSAISITWVNSDKIVAGSKSDILLQVVSQDPVPPSLDLTAKVNGKDVAVVDSGSGKFTLEDILWPERADYYSGDEGIRIFSNRLIGGSWSSGFLVVPGLPSVEKSFVEGTEDIIADDRNILNVNLRDQYDNKIESDYTIHYSYFIDQVRNAKIRNSRTLPISNSGSLSFVLNTIYAGILNLNISFSSSSNPDPLQLIVNPIEVPPGDLSIRDSSAYTDIVIAGVSTKGTIISRDKWENTRFSLADTFQARLFFGQDELQSMDVSLPTESGERLFFFNSTIKGNHEMRVQIYRGNELRDFKSAFVEVHSGPIDKTKTNVKGDGIRAEVLTGSRASILIQPRDSYLNVIDPRDIVAQKSGYFPGYIVQIKPSDGRASQYYESEYCSPGRGSCSPVSDLSLRAFNSQSEPGSLSNEEELLGRTGYHRVYYKAPALVSGDNKFSIDIFQCNPEEFVEGDTAESKIGKPGCEKVWGTISEAVLVAGVELASQIVDPWLTVVIGVCAGSILMTAAAYAAWRLNRYKVKYRGEKKKLAVAQEKLREMAEDEDILPGHGDETGFSMNPMLVPAVHRSAPSRPADLEMVEAPVEEPVSRAPIRREFMPNAPPKNLQSRFS